MEHRVQGGPAVPQRLLHERRRTSTASRRRSSTAPRRRPRRTGATSTCSGDPNDPPNVRSNFDPGHRITFSGGYDIPHARRLHGHGVGVLQRPVGPSRGRRTTAATTTATCARPTTCSTSRRARRSRVHLYQRHVPGPDDVRQRRAVPGGLHRAGPRAQRVPRALDQHAWTSASTSACRSSACKAEITWDMLNLINLFDSQDGLLEYAELQRPARRSPDDQLEPAPPPTTWRTSS